MRKHLLLAALFIVAIALTAGPSSAQVTLAQATAFFKDFDEQAFSGKGPDINAVYLPGVAAPPRRRKSLQRGDNTPTT